MNNMNQSEKINIQLNNTSQTNFVDEYTPLAPTPSAAGAAQFLDQLLPKTAGVSSPERVLIEEIKKKHLATMDTNRRFDALSAGELSIEELRILQKKVLNANVNVDVLSKFASLLSTSLTKLISQQ
ncbi:type III secretion system inner rod subunit SctI [Citrobacter rodentium]|nr:type III secretion system inner rod subunit SctI [Citrobacter rodentium]KIQ51444.1 type III secretion apparatus protein [Citrobacter rodentium]QBY29433.1 EscI/YscI/HrpB family type III secretion system inner rod protein [Citrobacter rodentium]UHO33471.1 type III secretion system inner rod subunit SctI [Citrobacter rodentium NBRC 105723 = DSM 16636]HAT8015387.1 EscI/YscI/HrpB family type III secretion system inner rod protein [Citrobacter rodentium NBRC 105723 = DSM 16636]HAT8020226.1 EscI/Y